MWQLEAFWLTSMRQSAHAEQDAERARAEVKVARADTQDLRAECSQLRNQIASNLTDVKDTIKVYTVRLHILNLFLHVSHILSLLRNGRMNWL